MDLDELDWVTDIMVTVGPGGITPDTVVDALEAEGYPTTNENIAALMQYAKRKFGL